MDDLKEIRLAYITGKYPVVLKRQQDIKKYVSLSNGKVTVNYENVEDGKSAYIKDDSVIGFASAPSHTEMDYKELADRAYNNIEKIVRHRRKNNKQLKEHITNYGKCPSKSLDMESVAFYIDNIIKKYSNENVERNIDLVSYYTEKQFCGEKSGYVKTNNIVTFLMINISDKNTKGEPISVERLTGWNGEARDGKKIPNLPLFIQQTCRMLEDKKDTVPVEPGVKDVILSCRITGLLVHEAIGHTAEADNVLAGSVAGQVMGKQICNEEINIVDFANHYGDRELIAPIYYDDEGNEARDVEIIKNGVFSGLMTDNYTSAVFGLEPSGNARAATYNDLALVRMRNTAMLPGKKKIEDIISTIDDGYFIIDGVSGQSDLSGAFAVVPSVVYEIKNGVVGKAVDACQITGNCLEVLNSITDISDRFDWYVGICAKEQEVVVSSGAPDVKCKVHIGAI